MGMFYQKYRIFLKIFLFLFIISNLTFASSPQIKYLPERIILNITESPATSQAVTWRTEKKVSRPQAQIAAASEFTDLKKEAKTFEATTEPVKIGRRRVVYQYAVIFDTLQANTLYAYRVGAEKHWSEWNQFKTASATAEPFKFIYFGDPQNEIKSMCSRIFRAAYTKAPEARFWLFTGDIVDLSTDDDEWGELYYALGWIPRMTPMVMTIGNHGYHREKVDGNRIRVKTHLWNPQFTLPENGPDGLEETAYFVDYQGVRFVILNGSEKLEQQVTWLDSILSINPQQWTVVSIHQPFYSTGKDRDNPEQRELFLPIIDKYSVDIVLQGHDHNYGRTFKIRNGNIVADDEVGTVYIVSVSGTKAYAMNERYLTLMTKTGTGRQLFQVISIDHNRLLFESFNALGELFDSFELTK